MSLLACVACVAWSPASHVKHASPASLAPINMMLDRSSPDKRPDRDNRFSLMRRVATLETQVSAYQKLLPPVEEQVLALHATMLAPCLHRTAVRLTSCTHLQRTCCCPTQVIEIPLELILWPLKVVIFLVTYLVTLQAWNNIEASCLHSIGLVEVPYYLHLLRLPAACDLGHLFLCLDPGY